LRLRAISRRAPRYTSSVTLGGLQRALLAVLEGATLFVIASGCSGARGAATGESCSPSASMDAACGAADAAKSSSADATMPPGQCGCASPPICGTACQGACGCCSCSAGDTESVGNERFVCNVGLGCFEPASTMTSEAGADASSGEEGDDAELQDGSDGDDGGAALGAGCVPEEELDKSFLGFGLTEVSLESRTFSCASRLCLVNHFQGRVTCPYGQSADGGGYPPASGCTIPGTDTPVDGKDSNGTVVDPTKQALVQPQCIHRTASEAVVCSCRCANTSGGVDDAGPYCTCPSGFDCAQLVSSIGGANPGLSGAYCIKSGTEYDPLDASACGPTTLCDPKVASCGPAQGVSDAGPL
jgi:hypothetical protein